MSVAAGRPRATTWTRRSRRLVRSAPGWLGAAVLVAAALGALFAPYLVDWAPDQQVLRDRLLEPMTPGQGGSSHALGTDQLGRDILSRILHGGRVSLTIGLVTATLAAVVGTSLGVLAGFREGWVGWGIRNVIDIQTAFPFMVIAIAVVAVVGANVPTLIIVLALWTWLPFARLSHSVVLGLKQSDYVRGARAIGASQTRILFRHILPNILPPLLVVWTFVVAHVIIAESALSFLGLGVPPPTPTWGGMVSDGREYLESAWWVALFPGLAISLVVLSVNLVGDALRDRFDPFLEV